MAYFIHITLIGNNTDAGVEGQQTPLIADLPSGSYQIEFYVKAINFRAEFEKITKRYVAGLEYTETRTRIVCDLFPAETDDTYEYPESVTTVEAFYHVPTLNLKRYWLKFNDSDGSYNLPPNMNISTMVWACNIAELEIQAAPERGAYTLIGKLTAITEE
jgi:hypothetical protein